MELMPVYPNAEVVPPASVIEVFHMFAQRIDKSMVIVNSVDENVAFGFGHFHPRIES